MLESVFGPTITLSTGRVIPTRWVGEQHVQQDLGFIPSFADWMRAIRPLPWMGAAAGSRIALNRRHHSEGTGDSRTINPEVGRLHPASEACRYTAASEVPSDPKK
jgi:hypothetical protein